MQARRLPAARGAFWLLEGLRLFRRNPSLIAALTLIYLLLMQVLVALVPGIGPVLLPLFLPALTLIVANGCRLVDLGHRPDRAHLLHGIAGNMPAMLRLGGLQLVGAVLVVLLGMALGGDGSLLVGAEPPTPSMGENPGDTAPGGEANEAAVQAAMLGTLLRVFLLALPLILAFWFAPFLAGWDRISPLKAVFFSAVAAWRNWRAMGVFSLTAAMLTGVFPGMLLIAVSQVSGMALSVVFVALRMVLVFFVAPVLTASIYISYRDIFRPAVDTNA